MFVKSQPWNEPFSRSSMTAGIEWNMWTKRQWPFLHIEEGDEIACVSAGAPADGKIMWIAKITYLVTAPYSSHEEAWELLKNAIPAPLRKANGLTRRGFLDLDYTYYKPQEGWILGFASEPVRYVNRHRPDGFRFRPNGWGEIADDSPALRPRKAAKSAA